MRNHCKNLYRWSTILESSMRTSTGPPGLSSPIDSLHKSDWPLCLPELLGIQGLLHLLWSQQVDGWMFHFVQIYVDKLDHFVPDILWSPSPAHRLCHWKVATPGPERKMIWTIPDGEMTHLSWSRVSMAGPRSALRSRGSEWLFFSLTNMDQQFQMSFP